VLSGDKHGQLAVSHMTTSALFFTCQPLTPAAFKALCCQPAQVHVRMFIVLCNAEGARIDGCAPLTLMQVWDFEKVHERTVHKVNRALTNTIRCLRGGDGMSACCASADGTVKVRLPYQHAWRCCDLRSRRATSICCAAILMCDFGST